ncbi:uncharacterized protein BO87DRAFT_81252 [Aspergillus neoniger CBS 115656]|uniref:Uncharacterized protein n=1 Tax=Aspergillus neoniger (strain CBS 115656) TaxID=1448310 RepID=A0A318YWU2_ASPNB|nr:hypothetical protein BO87DRAFT_81252 [Aspergillus neoniger CBS 115656]PYH39355.1 hypothetical protein BO87DRAFT_81252 [Aspergillus neoniger CBS 115656]
MGLPGDFRTIRPANWWAAAASGNFQVPLYNTGRYVCMIAAGGIPVDASLLQSWVFLLLRLRSACDTNPPPKWIILDSIPLDWPSTPTPFLLRSPHP